MFLQAAARRHFNPDNRKRNFALAGGAVGILVAGIAYAAEDNFGTPQQSPLTKPLSIGLLALGGMVVGALVGGARRAEDFNEALFQPAKR